MSKSAKAKAETAKAETAKAAEAEAAATAETAKAAEAEAAATARNKRAVEVVLHYSSESAARIAVGNAMDGVLAVAIVAGHAGRVAARIVAEMPRWEGSKAAGALSKAHFILDALGGLLPEHTNMSANDIRKIETQVPRMDGSPGTVKVQAVERQLDGWAGWREASKPEMSEMERAQAKEAKALQATREQEAMVDATIAEMGLLRLTDVALVTLVGALAERAMRDDIGITHLLQMVSDAYTESHASQTARRREAESTVNPAHEAGLVNA